MNRQSPTSLLLATDRLASPLLEAGAASPTARAAYTPYGYRPGGAKGMQSRTGFTGQLRETEIGWYMLGNGHRAYNPILMRFHSPDQLSPFGAGGLNSYAYCSGNPVNFKDPSGRFISAAIAMFGIALGITSSYLYIARTMVNISNNRRQGRALDAESGYLAATALTTGAGAVGGMASLLGASESVVTGAAGITVASGLAALTFDTLAESSPPRVQRISRPNNGQDWMSRNASRNTHRTELTSYEGPDYDYAGLGELGELGYQSSSSSNALVNGESNDEFSNFALNLVTDIAVRQRAVRRLDGLRIENPTPFDFSRHFSDV